MPPSTKEKLFTTLNETAMIESNWKLLPNGKGLYVLTLESTEGTDKCWVNEEELFKLKALLNSLEIPQPENELPL